VNVRGAPLTRGVGRNTAFGAQGTHSKEDIHTYPPGHTIPRDTLRLSGISRPPAGDEEAVREYGAMAIWAVGLALLGFIGCGVLVDIGGALVAKVETYDIAQQAARAGADHLDLVTLRSDRQAAVAAHTGAFAEGRDNDWIEPHREQLRRNGIHACLALAELLTPTDPAESAALIVQASDLDPHSEDLTQRAMRALSTIGDGEGITHRLRTLRTALDEIDKEPSGETLAMATHLTVRSTTGSRGVVR